MKTLHEKHRFPSFKPKENSNKNGVEPPKPSLHYVLFVVSYNAYNVVVHSIPDIDYSANETTRLN